MENNAGALWLGIWGGRLESEGLHDFADVLGGWHHAASTYDDVTQRAEIYLNSELVISGTIAAAIDQTANTLYIGYKEDGNSWYHGIIDEVRIWDNVRTQQEIVDNMNPFPPGIALMPSPAHEALDVARDTPLSWSPGDFAAKHNVYLGTQFEDVNNASAENGAGLLASQGQEGTSFDPGRLDFGQTYYWRVDEVNGAPDFTVYKGDVWSFTAEPFSIAIMDVSATASSALGANNGPEKVVDGSGLNALEQHGIAASDMWLSGPGDPAVWIQFAFDKAYKLDEMWVWNSNQTIEPFLGFGAKDVTIETSTDGEAWTALAGIPPFAQAPGAEGYEHNTTVAFGGVTARYVRISIGSGHGFVPQYGLSEVRFYSIPTLATLPHPVAGSLNVAPDLTLSWGRDGREAGQHEIYLGPDPNNLPQVGSVSESSFATLSENLDLIQTYYWRVDEVNDAESPSTWVGDVWNFTTADSIVIDGMEGYKDEEFFEIWATWVDGFDDPANNGAIVGAVPALGDFSPETTIVYGGGQSLPIHFDNSGAPRSEATRSFDAAQDWSKHGVQGLVLSFQGSLANTGGRLYVKINDTQVVYDGDQTDLMRIGWHKWTIDLAALPAATRGGVNSLTIGIDSGGTGVVYIDDILLTPDARELITPAELSPEGLVAYYPFDGDFQDASGNGLHGTGMGGALGGPLFDPGQSGQAILLDGAGQYVEITGYQGISAVDGVQWPFSISNWFKTTADGEMVTWGSTPGGQRLSWRIDLGNLRTEHGNGNLRGNTRVNDGEWHHGALVVQEGANLRVPNTTLYIDGLADGVNSGDDDLYNLTPGVDVSIGRRATSDDRYFPGSLDEVRIFDRALSAEEVAGLAGRTRPFDHP